MTWPADYAYGYNGSYRRGLPQPIDGPSACVLKVWWVVARTHWISLQTVNSSYLEQHDGDGPPVWWGKCNSRFFLLPSSLFVRVERSLTMHWLTYQDSTLAVSVRKQGREELKKGKPKAGEAHLPCPLVTLRKAAFGDLLASLLQLWY